MKLILILSAAIHAQNQCSPKTIEMTNSKLLPFLSKLVQTTVYRYFKTNLGKECPFWQEKLLCSLKDCTVIPADEEEVPDEWQKDYLSQVDYSPSNSFALVKKCVTNDKDFCLMEDETDQDGEYINLLKNPERYSGYAGPSAARVWSAIYNENCFSPTGGPVPKTQKDLRSKNEDDTCHEKQIFFKLISGLHTSISMHICGDWLDRKSGHWIRNVTCYEQRIGNFPDRIENLYFYWSVMVRAISKLSPYLENHPFCDGIEDAKQIKAYVSQVVDEVNNCPTTFDERDFIAPENEPLIKDFKQKFRNISRIMDCVGCGKCRLWGKVQTYGLGTALKILFSYKLQYILI
jgi:ERO1-like protein beta